MQTAAKNETGRGSAGAGWPGLQARGVALACVLSAVGTAAAQNGPPPGMLSGQGAGIVAQPTGSVSGRVLCADTQRPARFAEVALIPVADASGGGDDDGPGFGRGRRGSARTDLDGNFTATNLQPGDYYLSASATGYVSNAASAFDRASTNGSDAASLLRQLPQVHISANTTAQGNVSLERGGVIAGKMLWDDGSPAAGVYVSAVSSTATAGPNRRGQNPLLQLGFSQGGQNGSSQTDDRGSFRMTGLAAGSYLVRASFAAPAPQGAGAGDPRFGGFGSFGRTVQITLYAPGKVRRADGQAITLAAGEERDDVMFTADLRALHNVAGRVSSAGDPAVHSGTVRLVDTQDTTLSRNAQLGADGTFLLPYVPAGTYTLSVPNASSATPGPGFGGGGGRRGGNNGGANGAPATTFQPLQQTLTVTDTDLAGVNLTVLPVTASTASPATASR